MVKLDLGGLSGVADHFRLRGILGKNAQADGPPGIERCESPIEELFYRAIYPYQSKSIGLLKPQYQYDIYRLDLAITHGAGWPDLAFYVELDGHDYHSSPDQKTRDAQRQNYLMAHGWMPIRFTGSMVNSDPDRCARSTVEIITRLSKYL